MDNFRGVGGLFREGSVIVRLCFLTRRSISLSCSWLSRHIGASLGEIKIACCSRLAVSSTVGGIGVSCS